MNYINKYPNRTAYNSDSTKQYPNVSYIEGEDKLVFANPIYRWEWDSEYHECDDCTLYGTKVKQVSYDNGQTWSNVVPEEREINYDDFIEDDSEECGCGEGDCETEWYGAADYENDGMGGMDSYRVLGMKIEGDASIDPNVGWSHYVIFSTEGDEKIKVVAEACCSAGCECGEGNDDPECDGYEEGYCPDSCWQIHYLIYTYDYDEAIEDYKWSDDPVGEVDTCNGDENYVGLNNYFDYEWYYIDTNDISPNLEDPNNLQLYVTNCPNE